MAVLTESQINTIVDKVVPVYPTVRANTSRVPTGISRIIDNRGRLFTHPLSAKTAFNAGSTPLAVIGGLYMCSDSRMRTTGWDVVHNAASDGNASGDDCLDVNTVGGKFYMHGCVWDSTFDAIAPGKGIDANRSRTTYLLEHCYWRVIRDECIENDASLVGKWSHCLVDTCWMMISMRNPNVQMAHKGFTELEHVLCRFGCIIETRANNSGCGPGWGGGAKVFKAGPDTGGANYKGCLFLWEARSNNHTEDQSWRPGTYEDVFVLYAPRGVPQPYFDPLPSPNVTDLGVYENGYEVWLRARDRWLRQHDCRPRDNFFGLACRPGENSHPYPNLAPIPEVWGYNYGPRTGTDPGPTDPEPPARPTLSTTSLQPREVRVAWTSSAEVGRTIRYNLRRNGVVVLNQTTALTHIDTNVVPQTSYSYTVEAVDTTTGQSSGQTTALQVTTPAEPDPEPEDIPIPSLQATLIQARQVTLQWNNVATAGQTLRYNLRRNTTLIAPNLTGLQHIDTSVLPQQTYQYTIEAIEPSTSRTSGQSPNLQVTTPAENIPNQAPSTPTNLRTTGVSLTSVALAWNASTDPDGTVVRYNLRRGGTIIAQPTGLTHTDNTVQPGGFYSYDVQAVDDDGATSARTGNLDVQVPSPPENQAPTTPAGLTAAAVAARQVSLSWQESSDPDGEVVFYRVYRDGVVIAQTVLLTKVDTDVQPSTTYRYAVDAVDDQDKPSGKSQEISVTTPAAPEPPDGMADPAIVERLLKLENMVIRLTELSGELMRLLKKASDLKEKMF